eukprot:scaffold2858_cov659-Pavlova_lutheri.AAC.70
MTSALRSSPLPMGATSSNRDRCTWPTFSLAMACVRRVRPAQSRVRGLDGARCPSLHATNGVQGYRYLVPIASIPRPLGIDIHRGTWHGAARAQHARRLRIRWKTAWRRHLAWLLDPRARAFPSGRGRCSEGGVETGLVHVHRRHSARMRRTSRAPSPRACSPPKASKPSTDAFGRAMPKQEVGATRFERGNQGRDVRIAIFDSGVDPSAHGLRFTSNGSVKVVDVIDCTGSGDVDTSQVVRLDAEGTLWSARGRALSVHPAWTNPSAEWHVGTKRMYELFTSSTVSRVKAKRKERWEHVHRDTWVHAKRALVEAKKSDAMAKEDVRKRVKELEARLHVLQEGAEKHVDLGPVLDVVCWHDGDHWRVALEIDDACERTDEEGKTKLKEFAPMADYHVEHDARQFTSLDACTYCIHVYDDGNVVSIVTDSSAHGTHVAGIAAAYHEDTPSMNGVAPAAEIVSCKIGDSRLQGMETGVGLTRAAIAAIHAKADLINMSYGEAAHTPNVGRFVDIAEELVWKHNITFVSSAGNEGPALTTVGAPGGTSTAILGVGAWVSADLAKVGHSVRELPPLLDRKDGGLQYTWSSRGPTTDGDVGVDISAPGGAIAPVPQWSLEKRMLMNGTSMSSPCCCGAIALLLSALKEEGVSASPARIKRVIQATAKALGEGAPDAVLSSGSGLIDIPAAFEYAMKEEKSEFCAKDAWFKVQVARADGGTPARGIYLRDPAVAFRENDFLVKVVPHVHEEADHLQHRIPLELKLEMKCKEPWVSFPDYLLLTHGGRSFSVRVDPTKLGEGLHYTEIQGFDPHTTGPVFKIPVTVTVPSIPMEGQGTRIQYSDVPMQAGLVERRFIAVPDGATRAEVTLKTGNNDTSRTYILHIADSKPGKRHTDTSKRHFLTLSPNDSKVFSHAVYPGTTLECTIAQFWGSLGDSSVELEVQFHSLQCSSKSVVIYGSSDMARVELRTPLLPQELKPDLKLQKLRIPLKPFSHTLEPTKGERDLLPQGKRIYFLLLEYKLKLDVAGKVTPTLPTINNYVYDGIFEAQMYMVFDTNKRLLAVGDIYPDPVKLTKGTYIIRLMLRHDNPELLEKYKDHVLICERELDEPIPLKCFSRAGNLVTDADELKSAKMFRGEHRSLFIAAPSKDKLPKDAAPGTSLVGKGTWTKLTHNGGTSTPDHCDLTYVVPVKPESEAEKESFDELEKKTLDQQLEESLQNATIKFVKEAKLETEEEKEQFLSHVTTMLDKYPENINILSSILNKLVEVGYFEDNWNKIITVCDSIIHSIDTDELAKYFGTKSTDEGAENTKKKKDMEEKKKALVDAHFQKAAAYMERDMHEEFEGSFSKLREWEDTEELKFCILHAKREILAENYGLAIKTLNKVIEMPDEPAKKELYQLRQECYEKLNWDHMVCQESSTILDRFPKNYPLF